MRSSSLRGVFSGCVYPISRCFVGMDHMKRKWSAGIVDSDPYGRARMPVQEPNRHALALPPSACPSSPPLSCRHRQLTPCSSIVFLKIHIGKEKYFLLWHFTPLLSRPTLTIESQEGIQDNSPLSANTSIFYLRNELEFSRKTKPPFFSPASSVAESVLAPL